MFRIGTVNIDTSHPSSFAEILLKGEVARYEAIYNDGFRTDEEVEAFINRFGLKKRYYSLEEMAKNIDIAFIQSCNWDRHLELALPFIEAGIPVFIDKPFVGKLKDLETFKILEKAGARVIGSSALRYTYEHQGYFAIPSQDRGEILHITTTVGVNDFDYAIHSIESILGFMRGISPVSVKYVGSGNVTGVESDSYIINFENGATAAYHICKKVWQPSTAIVMTTKTSFAYKIDLSKVYEAMLTEVCNYLEGKDNILAPIDELGESIKILRAGKKSKQNNGGEMLLSELTDEDPGFDGAEFEKEYEALQRAPK